MSASLLLAGLALADRRRRLGRCQRLGSKTDSWNPLTFTPKHVQIDPWSLLTFTTIHVQPGVEIFLTRDKEKCFISSCSKMADNMRTSQVISVLVSHPHLFWHFVSHSIFLFFPSFFLVSPGDFFCCLFHLKVKVNLPAALRLGWKGKEREVPFAGMRLCPNHERLECWQ